MSKKKYFFNQLQAIQCPQPLIPLNGKIDGTSGAFGQRRYAVGALLTFSCNEGHLLVGEGSIVCTETGKYQSIRRTVKTLRTFIENLQHIIYRLLVTPTAFL